MSKNRPYHVEARDLGVKNFVAVKTLRPDSSADKIRKVWDYRAAGLTVDQARELLQKWQKKSYHRREFPASAGRILRLADGVTRSRKEYAEKLAGYIANGDGELSFSRPVICWHACGRTIVTIRTNEVTWSDNKNHHWPESSRVEYTSYLIRTTEPTTTEFIKNAHMLVVDRAAENKTTHSLRGNWRNVVTMELLGVEYAPPIEICYKKVVADAENPEIFRSIYDDSEYVTGQKRTEKAQAGHNGGLYCYRTAKEAEDAVFPDRSVNAAAENKVIVRVEVGGKRIQYDNKIAVSEMTVLGLA